MKIEHAYTCKLLAHWVSGYNTKLQYTCFDELKTRLLELELDVL